MANSYTVLPSYTDWLGNDITPGDLVIVSAMWGRSASSWLGRCLEIRNVKSQYSRGDDKVKLLVEPAHPKGYNGGCHHDWPTEQNLVTGQVERNGEHPRPLLIMDRNVFKWTGPNPPILDTPIKGTTLW